MAKTAGIQLSYHNHNFEFEPKAGGKCGYDVFTEEFSPEMQFEIDVFWVKAAGVDPVELIKKLHGRVSQLHLKDLKEGVNTPSYSTALPKDAFQPLGDGIIPMEPHHRRRQGRRSEALPRRAGPVAGPAGRHRAEHGVSARTVRTRLRICGPRRIRNTRPSS